MALARPERTRFAFGRLDEAAAPIGLPRRGVGAAGLIVAGMFVIFAAVLVMAIRKLHPAAGDTIGELARTLFMLFWILGWSVGVVVLGALAVLLLFYRESFYLADGRLVTMPRLGPLRMLAEYDLAELRNLRVEPDKEGVRVRFDYGQGSRALGDVMPADHAERIVAMIRGAAPSAGGKAQPPVAPAAPIVAREAKAAEPLSPAAALALIAANLVPLAGVLFGHWRLDQVMILFWAESALVACYTLAKMAVVGRWLAIPAGVFFLAHFGGFMAIHFLFIYQIFVRGIAATGPEPGAAEVLTRVFVPLWPGLLALLVSHGVSFAVNFLGRGERDGATLSGLMAAPYQRVVLMQLTLIFGGWIALLLSDARPALALLVVLKIAADLYAHRRERATSRRSAAADAEQTMRSGRTD